MAQQISFDPAQHPGALSDEVWMEVLSAVDRTYADLVEYQGRLERQNAELEAMRRFLASILASVSDVLIILDRNGDIEETSASLLRHLDVDHDRVTGRPVASLFARDEQGALAAAMTRVMQTRQPETIEAHLVAEAGAMPLELNLAPRLDERGRLAGLVLSGRSVGELRQAYSALARSHDELKSAQAQLVRNEKLASLGRLLAGVAHELNNPISFVYANAHALERYTGKFETYFQRVQEGAGREELVMLREQLRLDREVRNLREAVQGAREGAERVRDIVEDLRRLSADGTGEMVPFDLVETTAVAANWVLRGARRPVAVAVSGRERLMAIGRPGHIQQVIMNLVQNAVDALEGQEDARIEIRHELADGYARVSVSDNGAGVPPSLQHEIFDPFFTTKPVGSGTGLGLSISHKIAEEHGGRLRLCPAGRGACFQLDLTPAEDGGR
ncbi:MULTISPECIES: sensor histidine kinase [Pannonibacter]|uniref:sensor histidine kinase n=1 Tax=Pannonibacter TaxID=227873 RepID=UPI000B96937F|nr:MULTISPECIES: ATP-binding protein [Pannonibacter]